MTTRLLLSDLIDEHLKSSVSRGLAPNTIRNREQHLRKLLAVVGNVQIRALEGRHFDLFFEKRQADGLQTNSLNTALETFKAFCAWAERARYISPGRNPVIDRRKYRVPPKPRLLIPADDFPRVLDCAPHPRDRVVVALGLYLFLRASEKAQVRLRGVDLDGGHLYIEIPKSAKVDNMPICEELDAELRRWLTFYGSRTPLQPNHYLVPGKDSVPAVAVPGVRGFPSGRDMIDAPLKPTAPMPRIHEAVKRTLEVAGYPLVDADGKTLREGSHTLRRSGARALYDRLAEDGHDGAIRYVQAMLHHSSITQTEKYLGIELDQARRDRLLRGKRMFAAPAANVVSLVKEG